ncbi:hypothetical protein ACFL6D_01340 [Spirochaetota bacterium]
MKPDQIIDIINEAEKLFPVDEWMISDLHIWPVIRQILGDSLLGVFDTQTNKSLLSKFKKYSGMLYSLLYEFLQMIYITFLNTLYFKRSHPADAVFFFNANNRTKAGDTWFVKEAHPVMEELKKRNISCRCIENVGINNFKKNRSEKSWLIPLTLYKKLYKIAVLFKKNDYPVNMKSFHDFISFLLDRGIDPSPYSIYRLKKFTAYLLYESRLLCNIFTKIKPRYVFIVCYYRFGWACNYTCYKQNIISVDIQHGVAGKLNYEYGRWTQVPAGGYELLPRYFMCWSRDDHNAISAWSSGNTYHDALITGNTWIDYWKYSRDDMVLRFDNVFRNFILKNNIKVFILFTHQILYGFPEWIMQAIKSTPDYFWGMRMHPCSTSKEISILKRMIKENRIGNIDYRFSSNIPLPALLKHTNIHVTGWSAVVYEAENYNIPSIVTHSIGASIYQTEIEKGICDTAYDKSGLFSKLSAASGRARNKINETQEGINTLSKALDIILALKDHANE